LEWLKNTIITSASEVEIITALLMDMGIFGVEIHNHSEMEAFFSSESLGWDYVDDSLLHPQHAAANNAEASIIFYLGTDTESKELLARIRARLHDLPNPTTGPTLTTESVNDQDWLHEWKKHFHPFKIGNVHIVPEWEPANQNIGDIVFTIDPGSAFGTGQHATTMLCIEALQKWLAPGSHVLDIGCGSGILSIISLLLGAKHAVACDIDPAASEITRRNASLNPICPTQLEVRTGDILTDKSLLKAINQKKYDVILANIVADVIIKLAPLIRSLLAPEGIFIASGIIDERLDDVLLALKASSLSISATENSEGWCLVVAHG